MTSTQTIGHTATIEDMVKWYIQGEKARLIETGRYEPKDDAMLKAEAYRLFANIWSDGNMSQFPLQRVAEQRLVNNGADAYGDLEDALKESQANVNPYLP